MKKRYILIDILKIICAFLVICIHKPFPTEFGKDITAISRIAVPIFFMISGFFWEKTKKNKWKSIKKLIKLVIITNILYFLWKMLINYKSLNNVLELFSIKNMIKFVVFNESPFGGHLWYLTAILYTEIFVIIIDKLNLTEKMNYIIPVLLITDLVFGKYSLLIFNKQYPYILVRNFMFVGIPYFLIGNIINNHKTKIINKVSTQECVFTIVFFTFTTCLERFILTVNSINSIRDHYISTTFLSISVFIFVLYMNDKKDISVLKNLPYSKYSLMIYIIHPIIITVLNKIFSNINGGVSIVYNVTAPLVIFVINIIILFMYYRLKVCILKRMSIT